MSPGNKRKGRRELLEMAGHEVEKEEGGENEVSDNLHSLE